MEKSDYKIYDDLTAKITAKKTFKDLLESAELHNYQPTIDANIDIHHAILKMAYDAAQAARGSSMRSFPVAQ